MDSAVPYLSAKDDYSLFNVYKHTALKTYLPFLRNQDFLNPCSHGDMENIKAVITPSKPHVSLANTPVHSSSTAFHNPGLEKERGISSGDARLEVFSDCCDINGFPVKTKDKDEAETILQSDGIIHGCFVSHCNNCTDGNIWASSTSRQTSVALSDLDIRKGKKRSFIRKEWPRIKDTPKGQKKRRCYSQKRKSATTQKTADPPASAKEIEAEPPNDFIHVRASRGQARDSHSLAERARTEKINKRLRFLKDLVPGCPKKVGKAVLLEELINYVQTLHKQLKVLSMKLAALSPPHDSSVELNTSAKEQPLVEDGGVLVPSFSFRGTSHDSKIKRASTSPFG